jgi:hypothetical protein
MRWCATFNANFALTTTMMRPFTTNWLELTLFSVILAHIMSKYTFPMAIQFVLLLDRPKQARSMATDSTRHAAQTPNTTISSAEYENKLQCGWKSGKRNHCLLMLLAWEFFDAYWAGC